MVNLNGISYSIISNNYNRRKGWTGKTTTAVNLGIGLADEGNKVLLVDADTVTGIEDIKGASEFVS